MAKSRNTDKYYELPSPEYVRATQELRRSNAAGIHGMRKGRNRQNDRRAAIERSRRDG